MSETTTPGPTKPVNINISFNISRKQVTQKINSNQNQSAISLHNHHDQESSPNLKPKNHFYRAPKTPELIYTDRNNLTKEFQFIRPTEELKRKRKVKRNSGDYTMERLGQIQAYHYELDKSVQGHKRGYSTSFAKKQTQQTGTKKKKSTKGSDQLYRQNRTVNLYQNQKQASKFSTTKTLKGIISKMINSELSKRSLPLPVVASKSKYSQSMSLTSKKVTAQKPAKKRGSKSQVLIKQKQSNMDKNILAEQNLYQSGTQRYQHMINRSQLLEKLGELKSVQNSMLFYEADKLQQQQEQIAYSQSKLISLFNNRHKIDIKTDQSIECIDQIHELEKQKFKDQFFSQNTEEDYVNLTNNRLTRDILQTYIALLNQQYNNSAFKSTQSDQNQSLQSVLAVSAQKQTQPISEEDTQKQIRQNRQDVVYDDNYLNSSDLKRVDDLLISNNKKYTENQIINVVNSTQNTRIPSYMLIQQVVSRQQIIVDAKQLSQIQEPSQFNNNYLTKQQILAFRAQSNASNPVVTSLRSQQLRQTEDEKRHLNQLKTQEIEKWNYLLEYLKKNADNQSSTHQVLQHVYSYLSKAKVDLIRQGSLVKNSYPNNQEQLQLKLDQLQKSQSLKQSYQTDKKQKDIQVQANQKDPSQHRVFISQQQQILNEEVCSFKDQYESDNDEEIKFMNLETIESALKNRLKILNLKKQKQLLKLQSSLQEQKISAQVYNEQRKSIEKWFKAETRQIQQVKKSIWKGYNQAKHILDKSYISTKIQHQRNSLISSDKQSIKSISSQSKGSCKSNKKGDKQAEKKKKMMKCLSENYLKKDHISYKQVVEEQQKLLQAEQEQQYTKKSKTLRKSKYVNDGDSSEELSNLGSKELKYEDKLVDDQFMSNENSNDEQTNKNDSDGDQQANGTNKHEKKTQSQSQLNLFTVNQTKNIRPHDFSPTMIHYEQMSKNLNGDSHSDQGSEQSFNYYPSFHQSLSHPYQYEEQKSVSANDIAKNMQPSPESAKSSLSPKTPEHINEFNCQLPTNQPPLSPPSATLIKNNYQSMLQSKLQRLTEDDREDIFQFLFLDLCIQIYQEPCYDNKIMTKIHKFMQKQLEMAKRKKGVKTNLNVVKDYLKRFCGYVLRTNKKVLANMNIPMGPTALQMLRYMHENDSEDLVDDTETVTLIVPISVFDTFERSLLPTLEFERYYDDQLKENQRINFLKNIIHIHNKALFDALNEYLDKQRPFGIWGKPFPWKKASSFPHKFSEIEHEVVMSLMQQKLKKSAQKVVEACSYVCGLLVDKEQSLIGNSKVSPGYIEQIRQDRISRMLANDMMQNEERWVFYDDEETQVMVEVTNTIYHRLLTELAGEIRMIASVRSETL